MLRELAPLVEQEVTQSRSESKHKDATCAVSVQVLWRLFVPSKSIILSCIYQNTFLGLILALQVPSGAYATFTTVLNIPPDPNIGDFERINSNTQLNLSEGGSIGRNVSLGDGRAGNNIEVNIDGGTVGNFFRGRGSTINISGGSVGDSFALSEGTILSIRGGTIGKNFNAGGVQTPVSVIQSGGSIGPNFRLDFNARVEISGGSMGAGFNSPFASVFINFHGDEFLLNGIPVSGHTSLDSDSTLTGTLADGSVFILSPSAGDNFARALRLIPASIPASGPREINLPTDEVPKGLRSGQTLNLNAGGEINDYFAAVDATLNIVGGLVGSDMEISGTSATIDDGSVGDRFDMLNNSIVNINGGWIGEDVRVLTGSTLNIHDGSVGDFATHGRASTVNIAGGTVRELSDVFDSNVNMTNGKAKGFRVHSESKVNVSGGNFGRIVTLSGSSVTLSGADFMVNGLEVAGQTNISGNSILSGRLEDGTVFILSTTHVDDFIDIEDGTLWLSSTNVPDVDSRVIDLPKDSLPKGLWAGQTLNVNDGARLFEELAAVDSSVNISGGEVYSDLKLLRSQMVVKSGRMYAEVDLFTESQLAIFGGHLSTINAFPGSEVRIYGKSFVLDNVNITKDMEIDRPLTISVRDVDLKGILADGTSFEYHLLSRMFLGTSNDYFDADATLKLILVPEPNMVVQLMIVSLIGLCGRNRIQIDSRTIATNSI